MTDAEKLAAILKLLKPYTELKTAREWNPDFNPADDGNYDDAYASGWDDCKITASRKIVRIIEEG